MVRETLIIEGEEVGIMSTVLITPKRRELYTELHLLRKHEPEAKDKIREVEIKIAFS
jgi:hypothetical protein